MQNKFLALSCLIFLLSCSIISNKKKKDALARVGDSYLYKSDLANLGVNDLSPEDSSKLTEAYIDSWIKSETFIQYANSNLNPAQLAEISQKVEDYRKSLISYIYEDQIAKTKLDSTITDQELQIYYDDNITDFAVTEPIYRYILLKRDQPFQSVSEVRSYIQKLLNENNDSHLKSYCTYSTVNCHINPQVWVKESIFLDSFAPSGNSNSKPRTSVGELISINQGNYYYLYKIIEKIESGTYPLEYVEPNIRQSILHSREKEIIEQLEVKIYNTAKAKNEIELYY